jgi:hypothetical protein
VIHVEDKSLEFRHLVDFAQNPSVVLAGGAIPVAARSALSSYFSSPKLRADRRLRKVQMR